jgi:hypothetical protein
MFPLAAGKTVFAVMLLAAGIKYPVVLAVGLITGAVEPDRLNNTLFQIVTGKCDKSKKLVSPFACFPLSYIMDDNAYAEKPGIPGD